MAGPRAYLDYNATAPMRPEAAQAVASAQAAGGNASSLHAEGRGARLRIENGRRQVAALVGARPDDVVFTSGGTEANATALRPGALLADGRPAERLIVGAGEHASVLDGHGFPRERTDILGTGSDGRVDLDRLASQLDRLAGRPALVSVQVANSETGVIQPVARIAALARRHGCVVHADAVQAAGRIPIDIAALGVDALTLSAHKLGGPQGTGALVLAPGRAGPAFRLLAGGGQEGRLRAGTENVAGIAGFGVAAEIAARDLAAEAPRLRDLRAAAEASIRRIAPDAVVFGEGAERLPNTVAFAVPGLAAETALISLDLDGVAVSSGSACSSGKIARSHVLAAMGVADALARGAIRVSFGWNSTDADVLRFADAFETLLQRLYVQARAA